MLRLWWLFHLRVMIVVACLQLAFPWICTVLARRLLENLVLELPPAPITWVSVHLTLRHGPQRFHIEPWPGEHYSLVWLAFLPSFVLPAYTVWNSTDPGWASFCAVLGLILAALFVVVSLTLQVWLLDDDMAVQKPADWEAEGPFLALPLYRFRFLEPGLRRLYNRKFEAMSRLSKCIDGVTKHVPEWLGCGFIAYPNGQIYSDMLFACVMVVLMLLTHVFLLTWDVALRPSCIPAVAYALILIGWSSLALALVSFLMDRYRVPVSLFMVVLLFCTARLGDSGYHFSPVPIDEHAPRIAMKPCDIMARIASKRIVVIAAEGGGIQSAAWTAQVLAGLAKAVPDFHKHIAVVSGTSGGAVGAMYFVNAVRQC
jgi:hypothetical protein